MGEKGFFAVKAQNFDPFLGFVENPKTFEVIIVVKIIVNLDAVGIDFDGDDSGFALGVNVSQHSDQDEGDRH